MSLCFKTYVTLLLPPFLKTNPLNVVHNYLSKHQAFLFFNRLLIRNQFWAGQIVTGTDCFDLNRRIFYVKNIGVLFYNGRMMRFMKTIFVDECKVGFIYFVVIGTIVMVEK